MTGDNSRRGLAGLWLGMLIGLGLALYSLLGAQPAGLPDGAVARINDRYIGRDDYARALSAVVIDGQQPLTLAQRRRVLERLIDEELLIQYGLDQGLARTDRRVRADLVSAVIEAKSIAAETRSISDDEARRFFDKHRNYFDQPQQLRVSVLRLQEGAEAQALRQDWRASGQLPDPVPGELLSHVPDALLPLGKLRQLLGASLAEAAAAIPAGQISEVIILNQQAYLIRVTERVDAPPAFEAVVEQVKNEMRRREAEEAVRQALDRMRNELAVVIDEGRL